MAIDVYMQIDAIKGESQDSTHQGWIEISQAQWGVTQPIISTGSANAAVPPAAANTAHFTKMDLCPVL